MIRYSRVCGSYQDFFDIWLLLTRTLLNQWLLLAKLKASLRKLYGRHHDLVDRYGIYVSQMTTDMFHLSKTLPCPFLVITGFVTRITRRVSLVEQEQLTLPEHLSSPPVFGEVRVTLYECFVDRCLSFCAFVFGHCIVCSSTIYGF